MFDSTIDLAEQIARDRDDETASVAQARDDLALLREASPEQGRTSVRAS